MKKANPPRHQLLATRHRAVGALLLLTSYFLLSTPAFASIEPVALKKTTPEVTPEVEAQVEAPVELHETDEKILSLLKTQMLARSKLIALLGYNSRTGNFKRSLERLLALDFIEMTIPDKPKSRLQKYRLTETGRKRKSEG